MKLNLSVKEMCLIAMCSALMAVFSQFSLPLPFTSVPVTLQIFGLALISIIVGAKLATTAILIFLFLGAIGLPVFANFSGGFGVLVGPTGGYLIGYIFMAFITGYASNHFNKAMIFVSSYIGLIIVYLFGTLQLKALTGLTLQASLVAGVYPFILKDLLLTAVAILIGLKIQKRLNGILTNNAIA